MKAIIVGHGPSVMGEEMGHLIDEWDVVIRLKRCQETLKLPKHFGHKTDVVGGSMTIAGGLREIPAKDYWIFLDSRHGHLPEGNLDAVKRIFKGYGSVHINKGLCDEWDEIYREARTPMDGDFSDNMDLKHKSCDELGEQHLSQGFKAILYACTYLPELTQLTLVGFDNIMTGEFSWSITRGPEWRNYPPHRWDVEHKLLEQVKEAYGIDIGYLLPEQKEEKDEAANQSS